MYLHALEPSVLRDVLDRISYPGLSLPRVFIAPAWTPETSTPPKTRAAR